MQPQPARLMANAKSMVMVPGSGTGTTTIALPGRKRCRSEVRRLGHGGEQDGVVDAVRAVVFTQSVVVRAVEPVQCRLPLPSTSSKLYATPLMLLRKSLEALV